MEEKIIEIFKEAIVNKYFIYSLVIIFTSIFIKSLSNYKLYLKDCKILNQKPKPIGFITNSFFSFMQLSVLSSIGFIGYTTYNHKEIIYYDNTKQKKKITIKKEPKQKIEKIITKRKEPKRKIKKYIPSKQKTEKEIAKEKLKREMQKAIHAVN